VVGFVVMVGNEDDEGKAGGRESSQTGMLQYPHPPCDGCLVGLSVTSF